MRVLAIGAHFDDIELGCGGSLARHAAAGDEVYAFVATKSGYVNPRKQSVRSNAEALAEGKKAMRTLGVAELFCGGFETLNVEFGEALNVKILRVVEDKAIELVYTHWSADVHHDHHAVALASLHSCRHVPRLLSYRSNWYDSGRTFQGSFYSDITGFWPAKEKAIRCHASEMKRAGKKWIEYFRKEAENAGLRVGVSHAEPFEVVKWLQR
ncbi:MAG: PIG-L family deacetylase [Elusimicrobia bacterium]|nr:PIG-L family deacetylase [Elusimicrobiota bacterium]